jgi:hypothetical protein
VPGRRPLPECSKQRYGSIEIGNRGGIITKGTRLNVPLGRAGLAGGLPT